MISVTIIITIHLLIVLISSFCYHYCSLSLWKHDPRSHLGSFVKAVSWSGEMDDGTGRRIVILKPGSRSSWVFRV